MNRFFLQSLVVSAALSGLIGCQPTETADSGTKTTAPAAGGSGHVHDHGDVGPHGGHLLHLDPAGVHAEWTHDDDTKTITVHLDDLDAAKISEAKFVVEIPDAAAEEFPLASGDEGWTITSESLMTHLNMGEAAKVKLVVIEDGVELSTAIEHHDHDHGHAH